MPSRGSSASRRSPSRRGPAPRAQARGEEGSCASSSCGAAPPASPRWSGVPADRRTRAAAPTAPWPSAEPTGVVRLRCASANASSPPPERGGGGQPAAPRVHHRRAAEQRGTAARALARASRRGPDERRRNPLDHRQGVEGLSHTPYVDGRRRAGGHRMAEAGASEARAARGALRHQARVARHDRREGAARRPREARGGEGGAAAQEAPPAGGAPLADAAVITSQVKRDAHHVAQEQMASGCSSSSGRWRSPRRTRRCSSRTRSSR